MDGEGGWKTGGCYGDLVGRLQLGRCNRIAVIAKIIPDIFTEYLSQAY